VKNALRNTGHPAVIARYTEIQKACVIFTTRALVPVRSVLGYRQTSLWSKSQAQYYAREVQELCRTITRRILLHTKAILFLRHSYISTATPRSSSTSDTTSPQASQSKILQNHVMGALSCSSKRTIWQLR
jgi:hypothetical protein